MKYFCPRNRSSRSDIVGNGYAFGIVPVTIRRTYLLYWDTDYYPMPYATFMTYAGYFPLLTHLCLCSILGFTKLPVGYSVTPYSAHIVSYQALTHGHYLILIGYSLVVL